MTAARARDLHTTSQDEDCQTVSAETLDISLSAERVILGIAGDRCGPQLDGLVGKRAGGPVREFLHQTMPDIVRGGTTLHLLLDDLAGASLVAPGAWMAWTPVWREMYRDALGGKVSFDRDVTSVCIGFRPGSRTLSADGSPVFEMQRHAITSATPGDADSQGWHSMANLAGPNHRRSRRIDVWHMDDLVHADVWFQDSNALPGDGQRRIVHEYRFHAVVDPETMTLHSLQIMPVVLPYEECLMAPIEAEKMVGKCIEDFRLSVPATLPGPLGCTHLNDMMRGLQDVRALSTTLASLAARV